MTPRTDSGSGRDGEGSSWAERLLVAISVIITIGIVAFVLWQASMTPTATEPTATITGTEPLPNGDTKVRVVLENAQGVGLVLATVEVNCESPPPELTFEHVPASDRQTGYVTCPAGTGNLTASVSSWTEA